MSEAKGRQGGTAAETKTAPDTLVRSADDAARHTTDRLAEQARDSIGRASAASAATASTTMRTGASLAEGVQEITNAWAHYTEDVMRQTSDASRALIGCRSLSEMIEVQARLLRGNLQAFLDQSTKIAEIAGHMATRPFEALTRAGDNQAQRWPHSE